MSIKHKFKSNPIVVIVKATLDHGGTLCSDWLLDFEATML